MAAEEVMELSHDPQGIVVRSWATGGGIPMATSRAILWRRSLFLAWALALGGIWGDTGDALIDPAPQKIRMDVLDPNGPMGIVVNNNTNAVQFVQPDGTPENVLPVYVAEGTSIVDVAGLPSPQAGVRRVAVLTKTGSTFHIGTIIATTQGGQWTLGTEIPTSDTPSNLATPNGTVYYVGDTGNTPIKKFFFDPNQGVFTYDGTLHPNLTTNAHPLTVDSSGNIYFGNYVSGGIYVTTPGGGAPNLLVPPPGGSSGYIYLDDIAVDSSGYIYCAARNKTNASTVKKYTATGTPRAPVEEFTCGGDPNAPFWANSALGYPGLTTDGSFLYVVQPNEARKFCAWTGSHALFGPTTLSPAANAFVPGPGNVVPPPPWIEPNTLYPGYVVSEVLINGIRRTILLAYNPTSGLVDGTFTPQVIPGTTAYDAHVAVGGQNLVVGGGNMLHTLNPQTGKCRGPVQTFPNQVIQGVCMAGAPNGPLSILTIPSNDPNNYTGTVTRYTCNGATQQWTNPQPQGQIPNNPQGWSGLAVDSSGNLYAGNTAGGVYKRLPNGTWPQLVANSQGDFHRLHVDINGRIWVLETGGTLQIYNPNGSPNAVVSLEDIAGWGTGFAVDSSGYLTYAATGADRLYLFKPQSGTYVPWNYTFQPPVPSVTPVPSATPKPSVTPGPSATPKPSVTPGPSATPKPSATPGPSATPKPSVIPTPSNMPEPLLQTSGGTPVASPTPVLPEELPDLGPLGGNTYISGLALLEFLGSRTDLSQAQVIQVGTATELRFQLDGKNMRLLIESEYREEEGIFHCWTCVLWDPGTGQWQGSGWERGAAASAVTIDTGTANRFVWTIEDGGSYDLDGKVDGFLTARTAMTLLGAPAASPAPTASPTERPTTTPLPQSSSSSGCSLGMSPGLILLILVPLLLRR